MGQHCQCWICFGQAVWAWYIDNQADISNIAEIVLWVQTTQLCNVGGDNVTYGVQSVMIYLGVRHVIRLLHLKQFNQETLHIVNLDNKPNIAYYIVQLHRLYNPGSIMTWSVLVGRN